MAGEPDTNCEELDALLECSDNALNFITSQLDCEIATKIGTIALLRIACQTGQSCQFSSLTVDGVTCGGDENIRNLINIVKCMQQICIEARRAEHICHRQPKKSLFDRGCGC